MTKRKACLLVFILLFINVLQIQAQTNSVYDKKIDHFLHFLSDTFKLPSIIKVDHVEQIYLPFVMARFEKYGMKEQAGNKYVKQFATNEPDRFSVVGNVRLIYKYEDSPEVRQNMQLMIKKIFDQIDDQNVWTGEGREAEVSMLRTSGYLFAQKAELFGTYFADAKAKKILMKDWILDWSSRIYEVGTGEYNSSSYQMQSVIGWLNLYDFAEDEEVRMAAQAVLDYYATEMALHYSFGYIGGSELHGEKIANREHTAAYYLNWLWFDNEDLLHFKGDDFVELVYAATSSYRPPSILNRFVEMLPEEPESYQNSKPSYLLNDASYNKQVYYRTDSYSLGSQFSSYGGWTEASKDIINWKLIASYNDTISEVRGNGVYWDNYDGLGRDPWTQWGQDDNILIQLTKVPENAKTRFEQVSEISKNGASNWKKDFKRRFKESRQKQIASDSHKNHRFENESYLVFPKHTKFTENNGVWFVQFGSVFMSVVGVPNYQQTFLHDYADSKLLVIKNDPGKLCGFITELADSLQFNGYEDFQRKFIQEHIMYVDPGMDLLIYESLDGRRIEFLYEDNGEFTEPILDRGYGLRKSSVNQHGVGFEQTDWSTLSGEGKIPEMQRDDTLIDTSGSWPVFSGPGIELDGSVLTIQIEDEIYRIDYQNRIPIFTTE